MGVSVRSDDRVKAGQVVGPIPAGPLGTVINVTREGGDVVGLGVAWDTGKITGLKLWAYPGGWKSVIRRA